ncbi:hypothetical protein IWZ03DRAFT_161794 [Phyllosticta citriasiana]|uniref:Transmembrane protein n=1 Tax=Phyllosticta citriasiana TaxID=595635 RepID=A0ABR1KUM9_9PEZI
MMTKSFHKKPVACASTHRHLTLTRPTPLDGFGLEQFHPSSALALRVGLLFPSVHAWQRRLWIAVGLHFFIFLSTSWISFSSSSSSTGEESAWFFGGILFGGERDINERDGKEKKKKRETNSYHTDRWSSVTPLACSMTKVYHYFIFPFLALLLCLFATWLTHSLTHMPSPSITQATVSASAAANNLPNISTPE